MKYLYYNGDSFCGDGVESGETFGELLSDKYNLEINHAWKGGSSNDRIYRTTVNHIMNNKSDLQDTLFIIGWTKPTRFELYCNIRGDYIQYGHQNFYNLAPNVEGFEYEISIDFQKEYISKFIDVDNMLKEHIRRVYSLESILKTNNCKFLFWNVFKDIGSDSFDEYLKQFEHSKVRQSPDDDHPNKLGHQKWFEVISSIIDKKNYFTDA